ncbi:hypothetical protein L6164_000191 [Bauhinia variegata]|uniref:Uncharacterized protein n=1 Tax=Bauhinia variegata TaxID=167791 RepID=A0ACB9Q6D4_BAUVA|nr:hypothetical protein L6164_000191 [Bauhinia variegata]
MRKCTRRSSTGLALAEVRDPVRSLSTRFSLTSYVKRVQQLTDEQRSVITKMGFGNLLSVSNHSLSKNLLAELMERWSCEKQAFIFDSGDISLELLDVALILGLRVLGNPVLLKDDEPFSDLEEEYGATILKRKVTVASLESRLDSLGETVSEDFIRAFLLYTLGSFLFPNSSGKVDTRYLSYLKNLDDVCQYAWGAAVIEDLSQWLSKRKENNVQYVGGCLIFLQTWSYEHFDIARPPLLDHNLTFPRMCRWDNNKSHQRQWFASRFKELNDDQVIWTIQPTPEELEIDIIKEVLKMQDDKKEPHSADRCSTCTPINAPGVDSLPQLSTSSEIHREDEVNLENQIVEDTPTSICDEAHEEDEVINLENLIVEETPPEPSISADDLRKQSSMLEEEDIRPKKKMGPRREQNGYLQNQIFLSSQIEVEGQNAELKKEQADLRQRISMLEEENVELMKKMTQIKEENRLLHNQISSNSQLEVQNSELKKEVDDLREEIRVLRLSANNFLTRMDRLISDVDTSTIE